MNKIAAIYTRYSMDKQNPCSIDDQIRNCLNLAAVKGYTVPPDLIFSDDGISGDYRKLDKRTGWAAFNAAWKAGRFTGVIADEVSRLARDEVELALLKRQVQQSNSHLMTVDGTDSASAGWALLFGVKSVLAVEALAETAKRTRRGLLGVVLRGYQVGTAPFGYRAVKVLDGVQVLGTKFEIVPEEAAFVRRAFEMRAGGASLNDIASEFNAQGVPARSKSRPGAGYWRPAQVRMLLNITHYAGYFLYSVQDEATGRSELKRFERPALAIVSEELFNACAAKTDAKFTAVRGGIHHYAAGLVRCGSCASVLSLNYGSSRSGPSLRCEQCSTRLQAGVQGATATYASTCGLDACVRAAIGVALTPEVASLFRERLALRLAGGVEAEIAQHRAQLDRVKGSLTRIARLLSTFDRDDLPMEAEYRRLMGEDDLLTRKIVQLQSAAGTVDKAALERQLRIDPLKLLNRVMKGDPAALGARLKRFFSSVTFDGKPDRSTAHYTLCLVPGAIAAELTGTPQIDSTPVCLRYAVKLRRVAGGKVVWDVSSLSSNATL